ncbi:hypothetical protein DOJK_02109 [Patescibacteria group bacterium]|nr:hypothetical protein DOJK_02109 [Patescibacteria group bacterium]
MKRLIKIVKIVASFLLFTAWMYLSWPNLLLLVVAPIIMVHNWMDQRWELSLAFWDGFIAVQILLARPLWKLDTKVRRANAENARRHRARAGG